MFILTLCLYWLYIYIHHILHVHGWIPHGSMSMPKPPSPGRLPFQHTPGDPTGQRGTLLLGEGSQVGMAPGNAHAYFYTHIITYTYKIYYILYSIKNDIFILHIYSMYVYIIYITFYYITHIYIYYYIYMYINNYIYISELWPPFASDLAGNCRMDGAFLVVNPPIWQFGGQLTLKYLHEWLWIMFK
jgi:hypothetical protein